RAGTQSGDAGESAGGFIDTLKISGKFTFPNAGIGRLIWMRAKWNRILLDNLVVEGVSASSMKTLSRVIRAKCSATMFTLKGQADFATPITKSRPITRP
ncbi:hypothetical protein AB0062_26400, partial [Klebsiella pneumoniae]